MNIRSLTTDYDPLILALLNMSPFVIGVVLTLQTKTKIFSFIGFGITVILAVIILISYTINEKDNTH